MKVAIISDIHGNMQALKAVLADIKKENCDKIWCLGDLAMAGPEPDEAIKLLLELYNEGKLEIIQGNTDEMIANFSPQIEDKIKSAFPIMGNALVDDVKIISDESKTFLKNLPQNLSFEIEGTKVLLVHGSPRKNDENIAPNLPINEVETMIKGTDADVVFCGHTHIPCGYQTNNKQTVINVGSVGRPFTPIPQACYVIAGFFDGEFDCLHKFIDYDNIKAAEILAKRAFIGADKLSKVLIKPEFRHI